MKKLFLFFSVLFSVSLFADSLNFMSKPMSAGKASLTENAYSFSRLLDTANFSPELKLPVQIVYLSSVEKSGHWVFAGKRNKKGWTFTYRDYKLKSISAPSGRIVEFNYKDNKDLRKKIIEDVKDLPESIPLEKSVFVHCNTVGE